MHLFLFTNTAQSDLFLYVRREYATAINFPCLITLLVEVLNYFNTAAGTICLCRILP